MNDITITTVEQLKATLPLKAGVYKVSNRRKDGSISSALIKVSEDSKKYTLSNLKSADKTFAVEEFYSELGEVIVKEGGTVVITPLFEAAPATADEAKPQMGLLLLAAIGGYLFGKSAGRP